MHTVYLVDDEKLIIQSLVDAVEWEAHSLRIVGKNTDPVVAVEEICALSPDIVFCDLKMPTIDGVELVRRCRGAGVTGEFVMLSAYAEFEASREFFRLGGHDYLLKPIDKNALQLTLEGLTRKLTEQKAIMEDSPSPKNATAFEGLIAYIEQNYQQKHTLKLLSERFHLSETYICDLFSKNYSTTFTLFMAGIRMRKAAELIATTNVPMKQICRMCGYTDYLYFCRVFKNYHGVTPSKYIDAQEKESALP